MGEYGVCRPQVWRLFCFEAAQKLIPKVLSSKYAQAKVSLGSVAQQRPLVAEI